MKAVELAVCQSSRWRKIAIALIDSVAGFERNKRLISPTMKFEDEGLGAANAARPGWRWNWTLLGVPIVGFPQRFTLHFIHRRFGNIPEKTASAP